MDPSIASLILLHLLFFLAVAATLRTVFQLQIQLAWSLGYGRPSLLSSFAILLLTFPFGTLVHEMGHYLAGRACRQSCLRFAIGPLELAPPAGRWTLRWIPLSHAGAVALVPSTFRRFGLQRALCSAGGPAASALAGLGFLLLSLHAPSRLLYWTWAFALQWALVGVIALVPVNILGVRSDGFNLWEAIRGGEPLDRTARDLLTPASHATPLRVADWPHDLVVRLAALPADPPNRRFHHYLAYIHFLDRGDVESAAANLDELAATRSAGDPPEYALEAAYFYGFHRNDAAGARRWLAIEEKDAEPWVRLRARAAAERASGNTDTARSLISQALALLNAQPACGAWQYEIDRLLEMQ